MTFIILANILICHSVFTLSTIRPRVSAGLAMNAPMSPGARTDYRSAFISDTHLGTRGCRSDFLADFLRRTSCKHLFLVGDIIDGWRLRKSWYWDDSHDDVLRLILHQARHGNEVKEIP